VFTGQSFNKRKPKYIFYSIISPIDCEFKKAKSYSHCDLDIGHCGVEKADSSPVWAKLIVPNAAT